MTERITVTIVTPLNIVLECKARLVIMPGEDGELGVLPQHNLLMVNLKVGLIKIVVNDMNILEYFIYGGVAEVTGTNINVATEFATDFTQLQQNEIIAKIANFKKEISKEIRAYYQI